MSAGPRAVPGGRPVDHPILVQLAAHLAAHPGALADDDGDPARAAVAVLLRVGPGEEVELFLIKRAERDGDPWSGQTALPGGRRSPNDPSLLATALRETQEETGIDAATSATVLGMLDELRPRTSTLPPIIVSPFVAVVEAGIVPRLNHEVAHAFWVPLQSLRDPAVDRESTVDVRGARWRVPSFVVGEHVVWGMTERIVRKLLARIW